MVVGNDRYGRQWVIEPIEGYLKEGFTLRYDRVRSGTATRLSVPSAFPREFVKEISETDAPYRHCGRLPCAAG